MRTTSTDTEGMTGLVRDTVDGLGELVGQHLKLARLELAEDLQSLGKRASVIVVFAAFILIGYTLAMVGLAAWIAGVTTMGQALLAIGLVHVGGGAVGLSSVMARVRGTHLMDATADHMSRSLSTLHSAATPDAAPARGLEQINVR